MDQPNRTYFQLQQAVEVAQTISKHKVESMFIGESGATILGYPSTTQEVVLFPKKVSRTEIALWPLFEN